MFRGTWKIGIHYSGNGKTTRCLEIGVKLALIFQKGKQRGSCKLLTCQPCLCAREVPGRDLPRICAVVMEGREMIHQGQIVPHQSGGLLWWTDYICGQGKGYLCHPSGNL